jgi:hypothetical protein
MNAVTRRYNSFLVRVVLHGASSGDRPATIIVHWTSGVSQRTLDLIKSGVTESSYTREGEGCVICDHAVLVSVCRPMRTYHSSLCKTVSSSCTRQLYKSLC